MEASGPLLKALLEQNEAGFLDPQGRFRIDLDVLKNHYGCLLENDIEAISFFFESAERWNADKVNVRLLRSEFQMGIELDENSPVLDRLAAEPELRLSALFPTSHFLFEFAQGYNILLYSALTEDLGVVVAGEHLALTWRFDPSPQLRISIWALLCDQGPLSVPWSLDGLSKEVDLKERRDPVDR